MIISLSLSTPIMIYVIHPNELDQLRVSTSPIATWRLKLRDQLSPLLVDFKPSWRSLDLPLCLFFSGQTLKERDQKSSNSISVHVQKLTQLRHSLPHNYPAHFNTAVVERERLRTQSNPALEFLIFLHFRTKFGISAIHTVNTPRKVGLILSLSYPRHVKVSRLEKARERVRDL